MADKTGAGFTDFLAAWHFLENKGIERLTIRIEEAPSSGGSPKPIIKHPVPLVFHLKCDAGGKTHASSGSTFEEAVMKLAAAVYAAFMNRSLSKGG